MGDSQEAPLRAVVGLLLRALRGWLRRRRVVLREQLGRGPGSDAEDAFFYDRDKLGRLVKVQSDVLLRVLASEIGDDAFFDATLERYILNTRKFFAKYPFTSIALDDPPAIDRIAPRRSGVAGGKAQAGAAIARAGAPCAKAARHRAKLIARPTRARAHEPERG